MVRSPASSPRSGACRFSFTSWTSRSSTRWPWASPGSPWATSAGRSAPPSRRSPQATGSAFPASTPSGSASWRCFTCPAAPLRCSSSGGANGGGAISEETDSPFRFRECVSMTAVSSARTNSVAVGGALAARRCGEILFVYTDSGVLDQLRPLRDFGFDYRRELRRRVGDDLHAKILQMLACIILRENTCRLAVKLVDDRLRRSGWRHQTEPYCRVKAGEPSFRECRHVG